MSITMDRYRDDQALQILNDENIKDGKIFSRRGLYINDYPTVNGMTKRQNLISEAEKITDEKQRKAKISEIMKSEGARNLMFVGKGSDAQGIFINDKNGHPRLMIYVDAQGEPKIQTINENGETRDFLTK